MNQDPRLFQDLLQARKISALNSGKKGISKIVIRATSPVKCYFSGGSEEKDQSNQSPHQKKGNKTAISRKDPQQLQKNGIFNQVQISPNQCLPSTFDSSQPKEEQKFKPETKCKGPRYVTQIREGNILQEVDRRPSRFGNVVPGLGEVPEGPRKTKLRDNGLNEAVQKENRC